MSQDNQDVVDQRIRNERAARSKAAGAIGAVFDWAFAAAKAFPENVGAIAWQSGGNLILRYDEHDAVLVLGVRAADGKLHTLHAVSADRNNPAIFGRPLDAILRAALEGAPLPTTKPLPMQ
jgi:hypothetical protein